MKLGSSKLGQKSKITTTAPNNEWFKNVIKSVGMSTADIIKETLPATFDFVETNKEPAMELYQQLRQESPKLYGKLLTDAVEKNEYIGIAKSFVKNAIDDLKSGKLYNKDREGESVAAAMGDEDFNFGSDDDFNFDDDDFNFDDDDNFDPNSPDDSDKPVQNIKKVTVNNINANISKNNPMVQSLDNQTMVMADIAEADRKNQLGIATTAFTINSKIATDMMTGISTVNDNLTALVDFNNNSMAKYVAASLKYYEDSLSVMREHLAIVKPPEQEEKRREEEEDVFASYGTLDFKKYMSQVKRNISTTIEGNMYLNAAYSVIKDTDTLKMIASNPLGEVSKMLATLFIPQLIQGSMKQFDETFAAFFPAVMQKFNRMADSEDSNFFQQIIGSIFGYKKKMNSQVELDKYHKGEMGFNGITQKAITEVIPTYLRKILSAITKDDEMLFDYSSGRFVDYISARQKHDDEVKSAALNSMESYKEMQRRLNALEFASERERENVKAHFDSMMYTIAKKHGGVNPHVFKKGDETIDQFGNMFGGPYVEMFRALIKSMPEKYQMMLSGSDIYSAQETITRMTNDAQDKIGESLYAITRAWDTRYEYKKDKHGNLIRREEFTVNKDKFGMSTLDYLRSIQKVLLQGLVVYPQFSETTITADLKPNNSSEESDKPKKGKKNKSKKNKKKNKKGNKKNKTTPGFSSYTFGQTLNPLITELISDYNPEDWNNVGAENSSYMLLPEHVPLPATAQPIIPVNSIFNPEPNLATLAQPNQENTTNEPQNQENNKNKPNNTVFTINAPKTVSEILSDRRSDMADFNRREERVKRDEQEEQHETIREFDDKDIERLQKRGKIPVKSISDLVLNKTESQFIDIFQTYDLISNSDEAKEQKEQTAGGLIKKLLSKNEGYQNAAEFVEDLLATPARLVSNVMDQLNKGLYKLVFGTYSDGNDESFISRVVTSIKDSFGSFFDWTKEHFFDPIEKALFGDDGFFTKLKQSEFSEKLKNFGGKMADWAFGEKDDTGHRRNGLLSDTFNEVKDVAQAAAQIVTGRTYTDSNGVVHEAKGESMFSIVNNITRDILSDMKAYMFGNIKKDQTTVGGTLPLNKEEYLDRAYNYELELIQQRRSVVDQYKEFIAKPENASEYEAKKDFRNLIIDLNNQIKSLDESINRVNSGGDFLSELSTEDIININNFVPFNMREGEQDIYVNDDNSDSANGGESVFQKVFNWMKDNVSLRYKISSDDMQTEPKTISIGQNVDETVGSGGFAPTMVNGFPYFSQKDPRYANYQYNLSTGKGEGDSLAFADRGCGPTAFAMVANGMGRDVDPLDMADLATDSGYSVDGGTRGAFFSDAGSSFGINVKERQTDESKVNSALRDGKPIIFRGKKTTDNITPFTDEGHFVVGHKGSNGKIQINDPNGLETSGEYDVKDIVSESNKMWTFDDAGQGGDTGKGKKKRLAPRQQAKLDAKRSLLKNRKDQANSLIKGLNDRKFHLRSKEFLDFMEIRRQVKQDYKHAINDILLELNTIKERNFYTNKRNEEAEQALLKYREELALEAHRANVEKRLRYAENIKRGEEVQYKINRRNFLQDLQDQKYNYMNNALKGLEQVREIGERRKLAGERKDHLSNVISQVKGSDVYKYRQDALNGNLDVSNMSVAQLVSLYDHLSKNGANLGQMSNFHQSIVKIVEANPQIPELVALQNKEQFVPNDENAFLQMAINATERAKKQQEVSDNFNRLSGMVNDARQAKLNNPDIQKNEYKNRVLGYLDEIERAKAIQEKKKHLLDMKQQVKDSSVYKKRNEALHGGLDTSDMSKEELKSLYHFLFTKDKGLSKKERRKYPKLFDSMLDIIDADWSIPLEFGSEINEEEIKPANPLKEKIIHGNSRKNKVKKVKAQKEKKQKEEQDSSKEPEKQLSGHHKDLLDELKFRRNKHKKQKEREERRNNPEWIKGVYSSVNGQIKGVFTELVEGIIQTKDKWAKDTFGDEYTPEELMQQKKKYLAEFKKAIPRGLAGGLFGTVAGATLLSSTGMLASLFLPCGPVGGAILGTTVGLLSSSSKFKDWMFGKMDEKTQKRVGGFISQNTQDFIKKNKKIIIAGGVLGALKGTFMPGLGIFGNMLFGGPLTGALMGIGAGMLFKSEKFKEMMFGKMDASANKRVGGALSKSYNFIADNKKKIGGAILGAGAGAAISLVGSQFGLIGSTLFMGPVGGALVGAGLGIATASERFTDALFGKKDEYSKKREGGLFKNVKDGLINVVFLPLKQGAENIFNEMKYWFMKSIAGPIARFFKPVSTLGRMIAEGIAHRVEDIGIWIKDFFNDLIAKPAKKFLNTFIFKPLKFVFKGLFKGFLGFGKFVAGAPFKLFDNLISKNAARIVENRANKRNRRLNRSLGILNKYDDTIEKGGTLNYWQQKRYGKHERKAERYYENYNDDARETNAEFRMHTDFKENRKKYNKELKKDYVKTRRSLRGKHRLERDQRDFIKYFGSDMEFNADYLKAYRDIMTDGKKTIFGNPKTFRGRKYRDRKEKADFLVKTAKDFYYNHDKEQVTSQDIDSIKESTKGSNSSLSQILNILKGLAQKYGIAVKNQEAEINYKGKGEEKDPIAQFHENKPLSKDEKFKRFREDQRIAYKQEQREKRKENQDFMGHDPAKAADKVKKKDDESTTANGGRIRKEAPWKSATGAGFIKNTAKKIGDSVLKGAKKTKEAASNVADSYASKALQSAAESEFQSKNMSMYNAIKKERDKKQSKEERDSKQAEVSKKNYKNIYQRMLEMKESVANWEWKNKLMTAVERIGSFTAEQFDRWGSIFGKKGLITAGLLLALPTILKFLQNPAKFLGNLIKEGISTLVNDVIPSILNNLKISIEWLFGKNNDGREYNDEDYVKNEGLVNALVRGGLKVPGRALNAADAFLDRHLPQRAIPEVVQETSEAAFRESSERASRELAEQAAKEASQEAYEKAIKNGTEEAAQKAAKEAGEAAYDRVYKETFDSLMSELVEDPPVKKTFLTSLKEILEKFFNNTKFGNCFKGNIFKSIKAKSKQIIDKIMDGVKKNIDRFVPDIVTAFAGGAIKKMAKYVNIAGYMFDVWDILANGFSNRGTARLFMIDESRVDGLMKTISTAIRAGLAFVSNLSLKGCAAAVVAEVADVIVFEVFGVSLFNLIASFIYEVAMYAIDNEEAVIEFQQAKEDYLQDMDLLRTVTNTNLSNAAANDIMQPSLAQKTLAVVTSLGATHITNDQAALMTGISKKDLTKQDKKDVEIFEDINKYYSDVYSDDHKIDVDKLYKILEEETKYGKNTANTIKIRNIIDRIEKRDLTNKHEDWFTSKEIDERKERRQRIKDTGDSVVSISDKNKAEINQKVQGSEDPLKVLNENKDKISFFDTVKTPTTLLTTNKLEETVKTGEDHLSEVVSDIYKSSEDVMNEYYDNTLDVMDNTLNSADYLNKVMENSNELVSGTATSIAENHAQWYDLTKEQFANTHRVLSENIVKSSDQLDAFLGRVFGYDENGKTVTMSEAIRTNWGFNTKISDTQLGGLLAAFNMKSTNSPFTTNTTINYVPKSTAGNNAVTLTENNTSLVQRQGGLLRSDPTKVQEALQGSSDSGMGGEDYSSIPMNINSRGCGPTAMAMVASKMTGSTIDPVMMSQMATDAGFARENGTNAGYFNYAANTLGIGSSQHKTSSAELTNALESGQPVILRGESNGDKHSVFTNAGHYVVATGLKNGKVSINDPRGENYSGDFDLSKVVRQSNVMWKFGNGSSNTYVGNNGFGGFGPKEETENKESTTTTQSTTVDRSKWIAVVQEVKRVVAALKVGYGKRIDVTVGGKTAKVRTDCSGLACACLTFYGVLPENTFLSSHDIVKKDNKTMLSTGFTPRSFTSWEELTPGDIVARGGHVEIFAGIVDGKVKVYNWGDDGPVNNPEATGIEAGKTHTTVWSPSSPGENAISLNGSSSGLLSGGLFNSSANSGALGILGSVGGYLTNLMGSAFTSALTGEDPTFMSFDDYIIAQQSASSSSSDDSVLSTGDSGVFNDTVGNISIGSRTTNADILNGKLDGVLKNKGSMIITIGNEEGVDPALLASILIHESDNGKANAIKNYNNPGGIMDSKYNWERLKRFSSLEEGIRYTASNLKRNYLNQGLNTIAQIGKKYAPVGASNDPSGLNKHWVPNVSKFYTELSTESGGLGGFGDGGFGPIDYKKVTLPPNNSQAYGSNIKNIYDGAQKPSTNVSNIQDIYKTSLSKLKTPVTQIPVNQTPLTNISYNSSSYQSNTDDSSTAVCKDLNALTPQTKLAAQYLLDAAQKSGLNIRITETLRTTGRQKYLYEQGRTRPGSIVTNLDGVKQKSRHQYGTAFDICQNGSDPYNKSALTKAGRLGQKIGLEWGGSWKGFVDMPHFQLNNGVSPKSIGGFGDVEQDPLDLILNEYGFGDPIDSIPFDVAIPDTSNRLSMIGNYITPQQPICIENHYENNDKACSISEAMLEVLKVIASNTAHTGSEVGEAISTAIHKISNMNINVNTYNNNTNKVQSKTHKQELNVDYQNLSIAQKIASGRFI